jgi:tetratricopeptide (TPR) repeat protein
MTAYLHRRGYSHEQVTVIGSALAAATRLDDACGQTMSLRYLGNACISTGNYDQARTHLEHCLPLYQRLDDHRGEAWAQESLAVLADAQGRCADALGHSEQALRLFQATGHAAGEADFARAAERFELALCLCRDDGDRTFEAEILTHAGDAPPACPTSTSYRRFRGDLNAAPEQVESLPLLYLWVRYM